MNQDGKDKLTGLGVKVGSNIVSRIIARRAVRGGKFAKWLVCTFDISPGAIADVASEAIEDTKDLRKRRK